MGKCLVFLSYRNSDETGSKTRDAELADELFYEQSDGYLFI